MDYTEFNSEQQYLLSALSEGKVSIVFTKVDGTVRVLTGTLSEDLIPAEAKVRSEKNRHRGNGAQPVFDLDKMAWRSFVWANLVSWTPLR